jgi:hypothetical protein
MLGVTDRRKETAFLINLSALRNSALCVSGCRYNRAPVTRGVYHPTACPRARGVAAGLYVL